jgi:MFS family permease
MEKRRAWTVLRRPVVRRWIAARLCAAVAMTMVRATFLWQLYELSRSEAVLGLVGLLSFVPLPVASLLGGAFADTYDLRRIALACQTVGLSVACALLVLTKTESAGVSILMALFVANAAVLAFESPTRQAMLPRLVPAEELPAAVTVMSTAGALAFVSGPALGGVLIAVRGIALAYGAAAGLFVVALALLAGVGSVRGAGKGAVSIAGLLEGISFVRRQRVVLAAMSLDLFAVIFGGAAALLPVYAKDILDVGARGYGILSSALEIGALVTAVALVVLPPIRRLGRAVVLSVVVYGLATVAFGVSRSFPLSLLAYVAVGMADQVSVVCRGVLVQLVTPDELRGRVSSVNMIFIGASNQLSVAEAGFVAALTSPTVSVVSGGIGVLLVAAVVVLALPGLWSYETTSAEQSP